MDYSTIPLGEAPRDDRWQTFYRFYYRCIQPISVYRAFVRWYFLPRRFEVWNEGAIYRFLGVSVFGKIVPTGGILFRRITGAKMVDYTLQGSSLSSSSIRRFFFRTCAFEAGHFLVLIAMSVAVVFCFLLGKIHLAIGGTVANLMINAYPMLLQRYTRVRILNLLARKLSRASETCNAFEPGK